VLPGRGGGGAAECLAETDRREGERREEGEGEGAEASSFRAPAYRGLELGDERGVVEALGGLPAGVGDALPRPVHQVALPALEALAGEDAVRHAHLAAVFSHGGTGATPLLGLLGASEAGLEQLPALALLLEFLDRARRHVLRQLPLRLRHARALDEKLGAAAPPSLSEDPLLWSGATAAAAAAAAGRIGRGRFDRRRFQFLERGLVHHGRLGHVDA